MKMVFFHFRASDILLSKYRQKSVPKDQVTVALLANIFLFKKKISNLYTTIAQKIYRT